MTEYFLILGDFALRVPQRIVWTESFDVAKIAEGLRRFGYTTVITHYEDPGLYRLIADLNIRYCLAATSWLRGYRALVNSTLPALERSGVILIPSLIHFLAYENKLLQAHLAKTLGLETPASFAVATVEGLRRAAWALGYPVVVKCAEGYGSAQVSRVDSASELEAVAECHFRERARGTGGVGSLVIQEFIPALPGDWKVIVVGDVAACLYRKVRPGDFRASGSGLFEFKRAPDAVLEFAYGVRRRLKVPWVSCDVAEWQEKCLLLEYQVVHFGTTTTDKPPFHLRRTCGKWRECSGPVEMEEEMALAVGQYLGAES